jgi:predicted ATPase
MRRYILTGTPGSGKTVLLRQLELDGFVVVEEAATDLIALCQARGIVEPWTEISFLDTISDLQKQRQLRAECPPAAIQFYDRSPVCTAALAAYLEMPVTPGLKCELDRILTESIYEKRVFFVQNLGFMANTEIRRINMEDALRFERIHEDTYRSFGFEIVPIEPGTPEQRAVVIKQVVRS